MNITSNAYYDNNDNDSSKKKKRTEGRKKIEIKKIETKSNLQVTFSKRRTGLFKKAGELCILCGAEVGILVFSQRDKVFCFGHPNIETILARFLRGGEAEEEEAAGFPAGDEMNRQYEVAVRKLEEERRRGKEIEEARREKSGGGWWWEEVTEGMGVEELEDYVKAMEELRSKLVIRANKLMMDGGGGAAVLGGVCGSEPGGDGGFGFVSWPF